jgi:GNAT superfamily N-acetyltransferase
MKESLRRSSNRLARIDGRWEIRTSDDGADAERAIDDLIRLHRMRATVTDRKQHADGFSRPESEDFTRDVLRAMVGAGCATIVALRIDGADVASRAVLHCNGATFFSSSGLDPEYWAYGPGTALMAHSLQAAIDRGDFSWLHFVPDITKHANSHWSGYILLAIYVLSQVASTYFMSGTMQKSQRYLMMILPFVFIPFIVRFPTGLVLYWMTTNLWTVGQGLITRRLIPKVGAPSAATPSGPKRSSRTPPKEAEVAVAEAPDEEPPAAKPSNGPPRRVKRKKKARR